MKETYQSHIVACIDLLGFKKALEFDENFSNILNILTSFKKAEGEQEIEVQKDGKTIPFKISPKVSAFSDHMVISVCKEDLDLTLSKHSIQGIDLVISQHNIMVAIINHIQQAISCAIRNGFLVRGAITVGKLYHTDGVIFGPALVQAFELEKKAKYPRVIVSDEIINSLQKHEAEQYLFQAIVSDEIISIIRGSEKKKYQLDNKSQFFVDYFRIVFRDYLSEDIKALCNAIELIINKPLGSEDGEILEKIEWFKRRYYEIKMEYTEYDGRKKIDEKILSQMSEQNKRLGCI